MLLARILCCAYGLVQLVDAVPAVVPSVVIFMDRPAPLVGCLLVAARSALTSGCAGHDLVAASWAAHPAGRPLYHHLHHGARLRLRIVL